MLCPICDVDLVSSIPLGDMHCPECERDWYEHPDHGVVSRTRRVRLTKLPEAGDKLDDIIKAIEDK